MNGMKVRYAITDMNLKISNVTLREAENSYVLLTASDDKNYEIVIELSHDQAEFLENEFYEANRRRREHSATSAPPLADNTITANELSNASLAEDAHEAIDGYSENQYPS